MRWRSHWTDGEGSAPRAGSIERGSYDPALTDSYPLSAESQPPDHSRRADQNPDHSLLFSTLLRSYRVRSGLTQQALADLSLISTRAIRDLEASRANARPKTVSLLADGLQLTGLGRERFVNAGLRRSRANPFSADFTPVAPKWVNVLRGREMEVRALAEVLESGRRRMISICGLPGVGKTRIAAEITAQLSARWPVLWLGTDSLALRGYGSTFSSLPQAFQPLIESGATDLSVLCPVIGQQQALIVLDGVADAVMPAGVDELLAYCPGVRLVSTSRVPWDGSGLQPTVIPPLAIPEPAWETGCSLQELAAVPSVRLLTDRLFEMMPGFELSPANAAAAAEMCRKLDGLPLALEMIAGRCRVLSLQQLAEVPVPALLDLTVPASPGGESETIGGLLRWSVDRLTAGQRVFLRELARFDCGWTAGDAAGTLHWPLDKVIEELDVLTGYGLVGTTRGEQVTELHVPNLLRAFLQRSA
jgi:transcriptional regulator with XRE-family HTH domain